LNEPTNRSYQFHKDPVLEDLLFLWPWGKKMLKSVFSWNLLPDQMKASFSRAAFNCVEKNVNRARQYNVPPKSMLVAFCENKGEKLLQQA